MNKPQIPLEAGKFYHVYNRGNNSENLFYNHENYQFFLRRLDEYLSAYIDIFAFCLLPNHFHLLIQVKEEVVATTDLLGFKNLAGLRHDGKSRPISKAFSNFFNSYSKAINIQQNRHGSLFEKSFRRKLVGNTNYFANLVFYIHANPQLHGIVDDFRMYPWSSYDRIMRKTP